MRRRWAVGLILISIYYGMRWSRIVDEYKAAFVYVVQQTMVDGHKHMM